jgi:hypothetical protein
MFKHFLLISFILIIVISSYTLIKFSVFSLHKLSINKEIVKYPLTDDLDRELLQKYSVDSDLKNVRSNFIFYQDHPWSTKNNNYIHDTLLNKYYIIDTGHYYYIPDLNRYSLTVSKNRKIKVLNSINKVVYF